jgi:tetratricopeptide (TPR) repeat protein
LLAHGAAAVVGTETSITDRYATRVFARLYGELTQNPDVVAAAARARQVVQGELAGSPDPRDQVVGGLDEWAVLTIHAPTPTVRVLDPGVAAGPVPQLAGRRTFAGLLARDPGEFVGRRTEQRTLPAHPAVGDPTQGSPGRVLLHGIGGVGKTTLAAEVVRRTLERQPDRVVATVTGQLGVDSLLACVVAPIRRHLMMSGQAAGQTMQALGVVGRQDLPWADRWQVLAVFVLGAVPTLVVLDNFEDNLIEVAGGRQVGDPGLADLLARWATNPGMSRLLVTCRFQFTLPDGGHKYLLFRQVGPLSRAETHKLVWALPALDRLGDEQVDRIWRAVGGHPRSLEYLDALLHQGRARFTDITKRLEDRVTGRLGDRATVWLQSDRTLDAAIADTVTLAADDVLLPDLLSTITGTPDAQRALLGLSVYREPVDTNALLYQIGHDDPAAAVTPDRNAAAGRITATLQAHGLTPHDLNAAHSGRGLQSLPPEVVAALLPDLVEMNRPPVPPRSSGVDVVAVIGVLAGSSLLSVDPDTGSLFVHRWTASELARQWRATGWDDQLTQAHRDAAQYWRWRVQVWPQDRQADVHDLLEARHHHLQAGDLDPANQVTEWAASELEVQGAWDQEAALIQDMLTRLPTNHPRRPAWYHQLGILAQLRGDYVEAERRYRQSLQIFEELGDLAGIASSSSQFGLLCSEQGRSADAVGLHVRALSLRLRLGVPQAGFDVRALAGLRARLGTQAFDGQAGKTLDEESLANLHSLLDTHDASESS